MDYLQTLEVLEKTLDELRVENKTVPIVVEGEKDEEALRRLHVTGEIIRYNQGLSIPDFCGKLMGRYKKVILLTDWDRRGGRLCFLLKKNLECSVECDLRYRKVFAEHSMTRTVEGLPSWIDQLKAKLAPHQNHGKG